MKMQIHEIAMQLGDKIKHKKFGEKNNCVPSVFPSKAEVLYLLEQLKEILFLGYYYPNLQSSDDYHLKMVESLSKSQGLLQDQIFRCYAFGKADQPKVIAELEKKAATICQNLLEKLSTIRELLNSDAEAVYNGDPACENIYLPILCYPGILCLTYHRLAHELYLAGVPIFPRMISEIAHSQTGIDVHPGAEIGCGCFIDHGTGVVIGETTVIGDYVTIYHGVTLGAKNFPVDKDGRIIKGLKRHPMIGNHVTIYSNAVILGRVMIGDHSIIGGNVSITENVPANSRIYQGKLRKETFVGGESNNLHNIAAE